MKAVRRDDILLLQPVMFDNIVNDTVQHLHEVVVLNRPGESEVNCVSSAVLFKQLLLFVAIVSVLYVSDVVCDLLFFMYRKF